MQSNKIFIKSLIFKFLFNINIRINFYGLKMRYCSQLKKEFSLILNHKLMK